MSLKSQYALCYYTEHIEGGNIGKKQKSKKQLKLNRCVEAPWRQEQAAVAQVSRW